MNNKRLVEVKIYLHIISRLEELLLNNNIPNNFNNINNLQNPDANLSLKIIKFLYSKQIVEIYNPDNADNYKAFPFKINDSRNEQGEDVSMKLIITNNYYNYFQTNLPYMK